HQGRRSLVDPPIPQLASRIVGRVRGQDDLPGEERPQRLQRGPGIPTSGCHAFFLLRLRVAVQPRPERLSLLSIARAGRGRAIRTGELCAIASLSARITSAYDDVWTSERGGSWWGRGGRSATWIRV